MASVTIYLNFMGTTEQAFEFYREVFGGEFLALQRMGDVHGPDAPEDVKNKVMHVSLPILGGTVIMGTDMIESMGHTLITGNNVSINLQPDTLAEGQSLFDALAAGAQELMPLTAMPWGAHFGTVVDRFGTRWMFNVPSEN